MQQLLRHLLYFVRKPQVILIACAGRLKEKCKKNAGHFQNKAFQNKMHYTIGVLIYVTNSQNIIMMFRLCTFCRLCVRSAVCELLNLQLTGQGNGCLRSFESKTLQMSSYLCKFELLVFGIGVQERWNTHTKKTNVSNKDEHKQQLNRSGSPHSRTASGVTGNFWNDQLKIFFFPQICTKEQFCPLQFFLQHKEHNKLRSFKLRKKKLYLWIIMS